MKTIFDKSRPGRKANAQLPKISAKTRRKKLLLPEVSELEVVRHYTNLSQQNFSVDSNFYPLGSCTMKYNPRALNKLANLPGFSGRHPYALPQYSQGFLSCIFELQKMLQLIVGMPAISLAPMAGAQGEFAGMAMIRAYHEDKKDTLRNEVIVPDAAHGTNPASAAMCGFKVIEIKTAQDGDVDLNELKKVVGPKTAAIMLTNPSTLGVFERNIKTIADIIHKAGGLLYYDGANLNAILGKVRPGDMGFDVLHLNLHKTFGTPHGGGGPGSGPVACNKKLAPFLPVPIVTKKNNQYTLLTKEHCPKTIGPLSAFMGNAAIMLRAYIYLRLLGSKGLERVADFATLNSNYLMQSLINAGFTVPFPKRRASHEFIVTLKNEAKKRHITAMDVAKRLLDYGLHAPTTYFPLLIPECLLIEPTETESKQEIDNFIAVITKIMAEPTDKLQQAPLTRPLKRLDNVKAARKLDLIWQEK